MTEIPHTCCNVREGVFWICPECHQGAPRPEQIAIVEALCDTHLELQLTGAPWSLVARVKAPDESISAIQPENGTVTLASIATAMETVRRPSLEIDPSTDLDPRLVRRLKDGKIRLTGDMYCPTWQVESHRGWRRFLIRWLRIPKRFFKPEKKSRVFYWLPNGDVVCSFENYAHVQKSITAMTL